MTPEILSYQPAEHVQVWRFVQAVRSPDFAYSRARSWRLSGYVKDNSDYVVTAYRRDPLSPTGVIRRVAVRSG